MKNSEYIGQKLNLKLNSYSAELIDKESSLITLEKGHTILWEGEISTCFYFIIDGIVRGYYIDEKGEDITKCFSTKNEFCSTEGFRSGKESSFTIETLQESHLIKLPYYIIRTIMESDEKVKKAVNDLYLMEVGKLENRAKNLILLNAEQRYLDFCRHYPDFMEKVELKYIASYIGVRPASLSRIRKNLKMCP